MAEPTLAKPEAVGEYIFLLTDIEGSTQLWEKVPIAMREALRLHDAHGIQSAEKHRGRLIKERGEGDSLFVVFGDPLDAVLGALEFSRLLTQESWPAGAALKVRMAIHFGDAEYTGSDYYGSAVNRCARIRALAHGGQLVVSEAVMACVKDRLPFSVIIKDLGFHRLKDFAEPEHVFQLSLEGSVTDFPPLKSLIARESNLPTVATSFVGRDVELQQVKEALLKARLVTLVGMGGCGKTRLAIRAATELAETCDGGAFLVDLTELQGSGQIDQLVAKVLGLSESGATEVGAIVVSRLSSRATLMVFDNCEQLIDPVAKYVSDLLQTCPALRIIATSRESLDITEEYRIAVPQLGFPPPKTSDASDLLRYDSVRLFLERAEFRVPDLRFNPEDILLVADVVRGLEGLPLSIELAAGRLGELTLQELSGDISNMLELLSKGSRAAPDRHRSLGGMIAWSYELLQPPEKLLFDRAAVIVGSFDAEDAVGVCAEAPLGADNIASALNRLVKCNMIQRSDSGLFKVLQSLSAFGQKNLEQCGDLDRQHLRHTTHYQHRAAVQQEALTQSNQRQALDWFASAEADITVAIDRLEDSDNPSDALALATTTWRYWFTRGHFSAGRQQLVRLLVAEHAYPLELLANAWHCVGTLAWRQADLAEALSACERSLEFYHAANDRNGAARALTSLGSVCADLGDYERANDQLKQALEIRRFLGIGRDLAVTLNNLALVEWRMGDLNEAYGHLEESLALRLDSDRIGRATCQNNMGLIEIERQHYSESAARLQEAVEVFEELGDRPAVAQSLIALGDAHYFQGLFDAARHHYQRARTMFYALEDRWGLAATMLSLADIDLHERRFFAAATLYAKARDACPESPEHSAHAALGLSEVALDLGHSGLSKPLFTYYLDYTAKTDKKAESHCPVDATQLGQRLSEVLPTHAGDLSTLAWQVAEIASELDP